MVPADVQALADVFDRGNDDALQKAFAQSRDLPTTIRGFRTADSPWPEDRKRTATFALQLAIAGLRSEDRDARDEGGRLLAEYHVRVREPAGADAFECWWFFTEATALQGLFMPENALLFIPRALPRCPANARLHLAYAFVSEQQWLRGKTTQTQEAEIVSRYEEAMKFPETAAEARVRAARFLYGLGQFDKGLAMLSGVTAPPNDPELRYYADLVRGQLLRASGRPDEAAKAFQSALVTAPGAQSARVALMTLMMNQGKREEAATLSEAAQSSAADQYDPWWTYWLGDYKSYPQILEKLRELSR
jgi:tetratricopeptide (TPR) repeat protein